MRTILLVLGLAYLAFAPVMSSAQTRRCGTTEYLERQKSEDPAISLKMVLNEELIQKVIANQSSSRTASTIYTIPVVFHVMWRTTTQNVSAARLADQLNVLIQAILPRPFATQQEPPRSSFVWLPVTPTATGRMALSGNSFP
jgi:hypothetical protein